MNRGTESIKALLLLSFLMVFLTGCSSGDQTPPSAGFTLSDENPTQWDRVILTDKSSGGTSKAYQISGGEFAMSDDFSNVVFLEDHTYTITQIVQNDQGEDTQNITVDVAAPDNKYLIDGEEIPIVSEPDWKQDSKKVRIRFVNDIPGQQNPDHIEIFPIPGPNPLEATYLFDSSGKITGTYLMRITKDYNTGQGSYGWTMDLNGKDGDGKLVVDLVFEDRLDPNRNVYDITIEHYTLSTGYFDFPSGSGFVEQAKRSFSIYYRGKMIHY